MDIRSAGMAATPLLVAEHLTKSFFGVQVLHGVGFEVRAGEALGLVGENGSGKSTSMNIVGGVLRPDGGRMLLGGKPYAPATPRQAGEAGVAFIHQELNLFSNLTVAENIFVHELPVRGGVPLIDWATLRKRTAALLEEVGVPIPWNAVVGRLSQGEKQLVEIAKAISANAQIIIFDEPTTSLTRPEVERLFGIVDLLKARGIGLVYISHALEDVMAICDEVTVLRDGAIVGSGRCEEMGVPQIINLMVGRSIDTVFPERQPTRRDRPLLEVRGLSQPGVAEDISLEVMAGEVVGLCGLMGSGRSELARMIFGLDRFERGQILVDGVELVAPTPVSAKEAGIAFLTEDRRGEGLVMDFPIAENFILASLRRFASHFGLIDRKAALSAAHAMAERVHLSTDRVATTLAKHLSGGNQQKLVIGKWLLREPRVFILDEPTRGIDVGAKQEVYRTINRMVEAGCAVLLISSEIEELLGLSDRILTISRGEITGSFERREFDREAIMAAATRATMAEVA
jgi:ABC-type sugar transport system ATPase subunit